MENPFLSHKWDLNFDTHPMFPKPNISQIQIQPPQISQIQYDQLHVKVQQHLSLKHTKSTLLLRFYRLLQLTGFMERIWWRKNTDLRGGSKHIFLKPLTWKSISWVHGMSLHEASYIFITLSNNSYVAEIYTNFGKYIFNCWCKTFTLVIIGIKSKRR